MFAPWPKPFDDAFRAHYDLDDRFLITVSARYELVSLGRNLRREANLPANKKVRFILKPTAELTSNDREVLSLLLQAEKLEINPEFQPGKGTLSVHSQLGELYLPLAGLVDLQAERARLRREQEKIQKDMAKVDQKLNNPAFLQKAPPHVLEEQQRRRADLQAKLDHIQKALRAVEEL